MKQVCLGNVFILGFKVSLFIYRDNFISVFSIIKNECTFANIVLSPDDLSVGAVKYLSAEIGIVSI